MSSLTKKCLCRVTTGLLPVVLVLAVAVSVGQLPLRPMATTVTNTRPVASLLIDAGHGGADGGAMAPDGTVEKTLNLDISLKLADILRLFGYRVTLTRTDDRSLHDPSADSLRRQKVSDMHNRLALYNQATLVVSIHQNQFGQSRYHGAQVFYSKNNPAGVTAATAIRQTLYSLLQPDNTRELKCGKDNIFLLYKTTAPAVLVECGFLSNPAELARLQTEDYRRKLAFSIACGVLAYAP